MNYRRRPWCSDHRQLVTLLMTLLGKRIKSRRQADRLVRLISKLMPAIKCNRTLSKISSLSICVELSRFPQNCFSRTLRTVWLNLDHESTGPHLASINTSLLSRSRTCAREEWSPLDVCQRILSDWPVSSNIWHSPHKPSSSSFCTSNPNSCMLILEFGNRSNTFCWIASPYLGAPTNILSPHLNSLNALRSLDVSDPSWVFPGRHLRYTIPTWTWPLNSIPWSHFALFRPVACATSPRANSGVFWQPVMNIVFTALILLKMVNLWTIPMTNLLTLNSYFLGPTIPYIL